MLLLSIKYIISSSPPRIHAYMKTPIKTSPSSPRTILVGGLPCDERAIFFSDAVSAVGKVEDLDEDVAVAVAVGVGYDVAVAVTFVSP